MLQIHINLALCSTNIAESRSTMSTSPNTESPETPQNTENAENTPPPKKGKNRFLKNLLFS